MTVKSPLVYIYAIVYSGLIAGAKKRLNQGFSFVHATDKYSKSTVLILQIYIHNSKLIQI